MAEDIKGVLRRAGFGKLKCLITYNAHVEEELNMNADPAIIPDCVNSSIKSKPTKEERNKCLLEHIRHSFDLEWMRIFANVLLEDKADKQNQEAGRLLMSALPEEDSRGLLVSRVNSGSTEGTTTTQTVKKLPKQVEQFLNCPEVTDCFRYCYLLSSGTVGELKNCGIVSREEQQQLSLSETTQSEGGKIVLVALLRDPCHEKLEKFQGVLSKEEDHVNNQELAKKIREFLTGD